MKARVLYLIGIAVSLFCPCFAEDDPMIDLSKEMGKIELVTLETSLGSFEIALFTDKAPATVHNFLQYVDDGFYDGMIFHRIIKNFIIQTGGLAEDFSLKETRQPIKNESNNGLKNKRAWVAMARTGVIDSATSQFFINLTDNPVLDHRNDTVDGFGYAVFGKVIQGMDVVDKIGEKETGEKFLDPENKRGLYTDVPLEPIVIRSVRRKSVNP